MRNRISITHVHIEMHFKGLKSGAIFECADDKEFKALYLKMGTRCVDLRTGDQRSFDQETVVRPLAAGTVVTLTVGKG